LLDPGADKALLVGVFGALTLVGLVPVALTAIVVGRDVVIVLGAVCYQLLVARVRGEPAVISKLNTGCQLAYVVAVLAHVVFDWPLAPWLPVFGAVVIFTSLVSGLNYVLRWSARAWRVAHGEG
jgi:cardiolipin synthase